MTVEDILHRLQRTKHEGSVMMIFGHKPFDENILKPDEYGF
ncbi:MAG: hypothetical protein U5N85_13800 [Arcicella sp.]|nr:hypothetical protein [Arcicella sp.]